MVSAGFYGLIIYLIAKKVKNKWIKYISCTLLSVLILLIGLSRIYLGVHYPSDVIGGFLVSIIYLIMIVNIIKPILNLEEDENMKKKVKKIRNSFKYAFQGIISAFRTETNMKIHFIIMMLVIIAGVIFDLNAIEWIICIILFGLVISLELINTAIETTVDLAMPDINEKAKLAKDIAAGAVLVSAIVSVIVGLIIFIPKLI